jgi:hypothetical protein
MPIAVAPHSPHGVGAAAGCGGSDAQPAGQGASATAGINGVVTSGSPLAISSDPDHTPEGHTPVAGAEVKVRDIFGDVVGQAITGADGSFLVQGVPPGYLDVEVRVDPSSADPDVRAAVTGIRDTNIAVNRTFPISRSEAITAALAGVPPEARVNGSLQPLPPGVTVQPTDGDPLTGAPPPPPRESTAPEWFFLVDLQPPARFAHPVEYVFVNAETGAVERIQGVFRPPRVNGREIWGAGHTFIRFDGLHPDEIDLDDLPAGFAGEPTEEVVQLPPEEETEPLVAAAPFLSELTNHNVDPASIFAIVFQGSPEASMGADGDRMVKLLVDAGVPRSPNIRVVRAHEDAGTDFGINDAFSWARRDLNRLMQERLDQDLHSTLVIHISSHGGGPYFYRYLDEKKSTGDRVGPGALLLGTTPACRLRVILDFCYSGNFAGLLATNLNAQPPEERPDYVIYAASKEDEVAWSIRAGPFGFIRGGGRFTSNLLEYAQVTSGDILGLLRPDGDGIREELDAILGWPTFSKNLVQHPSAIVRGNVPVRCQEAADAPACVTESEPNNFVDDANELGDSDCGSGVVNPTASDGLDIFAKTMTLGAWRAVLVSGNVELGIQTDNDFIAGVPPIEFDLTATTKITIWVINGDGSYEFRVEPR